MFSRSLSTSSFKMQSLIEAFRRPSKVSLVHHSLAINTVARVGPYAFPVYRGLHLSSSYSTRIWSQQKNNITPPPPPPPRFNVPIWARWLLGSILTFVLPFWKQKWAQLQRIEEEAEMVMGGVEIAAEVMEKVATATEKISADVAAKLPDGSKRKEAAMLVERVALEAAKDAHLVEDFIHKVEALKDDAADIEKFIEPIVHKMAEKGHQEEGNKSKL